MWFAVNFEVKNVNFERCFIGLVRVCVFDLVVVLLGRVLDSLHTSAACHIHKSQAFR